MTAVFTNWCEIELSYSNVSFTGAIQVRNACVSPQTLMESKNIILVGHRTMLLLFKTELYVKATIKDRQLHSAAV